MPNTYSKLAAAETTHGVLGDREHIIEELENHIFSLQGSLRDSKKKYNDLLSQLQRGGPVKETAEDRIEELTKQLNEAEIRDKELDDEIQRLNSEKSSEKERLEGELEKREKEIKELKSELEAAHKKYLQHPTQIRKLCEKDCVVWSLLWICRDKLNEHLCGRQLEKMITTHAERKHGITITNEDLCCEYFMRILEKCGIASEALPTTDLGPKMIDNEYRDGQIDKVWQELLGLDANNLVVMVLTERSRADRQGHCIVCDLKTSNEGSFECHDLQGDLRETVTKKEQVKEYVKKDERIALYSVDTDYLRKIIICHMHNTTATGCDCERKMLPAPPVERPVFDTEHDARRIGLDALD